MNGCLLLLLMSATGREPIERPTVLDHRLVFELVASEPDVVTPTGIAVDGRGRVLVIESHTHFRPVGYDGPPADRIRLFEDSNGDGKFDRVTNFFDGTKSTMNLAVFHDGSVFVATRAEVFRLFDRNDDGKADERQPIARLDTRGDYPHNGLSGFAFDAADNIYFGFGENLGADYRLIGSDGTTLSGGGEGGNIYRCRPDGSKLVRVATGFWNPFHVCFDAFGRLFAVDNDPDSRPPCRLLHIVDHGDYGYRFRNGRKGLHPFTAWNGELPGTLPMVAGTGEAPSGVVAYESDQFPADYRGTLLATSWGDHRIEQFRLKEHGASVRSTAQAVVQGGENFRPVGIAQAPDGSLYVSDWVDKSYELHKKGRVWRLRAAAPTPRTVPDDPIARLAHPDRQIREQTARSLAADDAGRKRLQDAALENADVRARAVSLQALAAAGAVEGQAADRLAHDSSAEIRRLAVQRLPVAAATRMKLAQRDASSGVRAAALAKLDDKTALPVLLEALESTDPFLRHAARIGLHRVANSAELRALFASATGPRKLEIALLLRQAEDPNAAAVLDALMSDSDPLLRFLAVQWIGEGHLTAHRQSLTKVLESGSVTRQLYEAVLAALERLDGVKHAPGEELAGEEYVARMVLDPKTSAVVRQRALRTLRPDHPALTLERLSQWLRDRDPVVRLEAVRTLRESPHPGRLDRLAQLAQDNHEDLALRLEAIVGLSPAAPQHRRLLVELAVAQDTTLTSEALRSLRSEALRSLRNAALSDADRAALARIGTDDATLQPLVARLLDPKPAAGQPERHDENPGARKADDKPIAGRPNGKPSARRPGDKPGDGRPNRDVNKPTVGQPNRDVNKPGDGRPNRDANKPGDGRLKGDVHSPSARWPDRNDVDGWLKLLEGPADAAVGGRVFYHPAGPACYRCHQIDGRGGTIGPELSTVGRTMDRRRLLESILLPAKEIAPMFVAWHVATTDGATVTGTLVADDGEIQTYADSKGDLIRIPAAEIEARSAAGGLSIMPDNLIDTMTLAELRDLLAYLSSPTP